MEKVVLFKEERPNIKIYMEVYLDEKGQLIFDGQDIGQSVEKWYGDSDYEYSYTIKASEVKKLYALLGITNSDQNTLLLKIKSQFEGNDAYSRFGDFMVQNNIKFEASEWF
jgi:hypothetical protein